MIRINGRRHREEGDRVRMLMPRVKVLPTDEGTWVAVANWIEEDTGVSGEITVGPDTDVVGLVTAMTSLIRELRWPWFWWPRQDRRPQVMVSDVGESAFADLSAWAHPRGWDVSVLSHNDMDYAASVEG